MKHNFTKSDILKEATKLKLFLAIFLVASISFLGYNMASSTKAASGTSRTVYYNGTNVGSFHNFTGADTSSTDTTTTVTYKIYATCTVLSSIQSAKNYPFTGSITSDGTTQSFSGSTGSMSPGTAAVDKLIYTYNQNITRTCVDRAISGSSSLKINTSGNYSGSGTSTASWSSSITIPARKEYMRLFGLRSGTLPSSFYVRCSQHTSSECNSNPDDCNHITYGYNSSISVDASGNAATPTRTGYTFKGWNTASDGSGTYYAPGAAYQTTSTENSVSFTGFWSKAVSGTDMSTTISPTSYIYDGISHCPTPTVKDGSTTLTNNTDYTYACSSNTNVGTATLTVTGKNTYNSTTDSYYTGTKAVSFYINNATLTFNATSNGGTGGGTVYTKTGATGVYTTIRGTTAASIPTATAPTGYTMSGWYTSQTGGSK
ncbi:MAG: InlB B-repeat-containing protein, partial [Bacilli bacterium]|nr:InlB B-repeat-containing protein [Bacilli bacterium]